MLRQAQHERGWFGAALAIGLAATTFSSPALAQDDDDEDDSAYAARPIVANPAGTARLNTALSRLAINPRDLTALIDAGQAALDMNDLDAAVGFFRRADSISPGNASVKAGLAGAFVRKLDPFSAIPLFEEAARSGVLGSGALADRGLAYDLVGDAIGAQRYYRQALAAGRSDDTLRRLALSQAIDGDRTGMEATLSPLLQRQDRAAWRTRAFALAVLGRAEEAESIARATMPADLAVAMSAYLRYMPRLTRAQQAAAGDLGYFPRAADIGRDDPRVARFVNQRPELAAANQALTPAGRPMGRDAKDDSKAKRDAKAKAAAALASAAPPEVRPARTEVATTPPPALLPPRGPAIVLATPAPIPARTAANPPPAAARTAPGFDLARIGQSTPAPSPTQASVTPARPRSLAEVFADIGAPSSAGAPHPGAVDVAHPPKPAAIKPATAKPTPAETAHTKAEADKKAKADADKKAKAEADMKAKASPARTWVQVRTGRDAKALAFDWRKLVKDDPATFKGKAPFVAAWGATRRLLTGPFASDKAADGYIALLKKAGVNGAFVFHSDAGESVDALAGK